MALSVPSYLRLSRHNVFYFRWPIPAVLHPQGKVQHVETSLRTRNPRLALQMARYLAYHAENITGHLIGMNLSEIKAELQAFFAGKLAEFGASRELGGRLPVWMEEQHRRNLKTIEQANSNGMDGRIAFDGEEIIHQQIDEVIQVRKLNISKDAPEYDMLLREYPLAYAQYQSFFGWAERQGHIPKNVFSGLQIKMGQRTANPRIPFTPDQIKTILAALPAHTPEKSGKSFRYWGVMLAIYTGARLNEIAQLALDDIQQADGIWYLNVTDEGDDDNKRLKNESSKRRVPVHAALLDAGFIDRVQKLRDAGHSRLFPDLEYQQGHGYGRGLTRWVSSKLLVDLGIKEEGLSFHSFRHSFITGLRQAGVELQTVQELVGHSKDVVTETVYNATAYPLPMLKTAIDKLDYT